MTLLTFRELEGNVVMEILCGKPGRSRSIVPVKHSIVAHSGPVRVRGTPTLTHHTNTTSENKLYGLHEHMYFKCQLIWEVIKLVCVPHSLSSVALDEWA